MSDGGREIRVLRYISEKGGVAYGIDWSGLPSGIWYHVHAGHYPESFCTEAVWRTSAYLLDWSEVANSFVTQSDSVSFSIGCWRVYGPEGTLFLDKKGFYINDEIDVPLLLRGRITGRLQVVVNDVRLSNEVTGSEDEHPSVGMPSAGLQPPEYVVVPPSSARKLSTGSESGTKSKGSNSPRRPSSGDEAAGARPVPPSATRRPSKSGSEAAGARLMPPSAARSPSSGSEDDNGGPASSSLARSSARTASGSADDALTPTGSARKLSAGSQFSDDGFLLPGVGRKASSGSAYADDASMVSEPVRRLSSGSDRGDAVRPSEAAVMISFNDAASGADAEELTRFLCERGIPTFCTRVFCPGRPGNWRKITTVAVNSCSIYVPLMTEGWQRSYECQFETDIAMNRYASKQLIVIPVWYASFNEDLDKREHHYYKTTWNALQAVFRSSDDWMENLFTLCDCTQQGM